MVDDFGASSAVVLVAGGSAVSPLYDADTTPSQVFADREGNEFCLISHDEWRRRPRVGDITG